MLSVLEVLGLEGEGEGWRPGQVRGEGEWEGLGNENWRDYCSVVIRPLPHSPVRNHRHSCFV